MSSRKQAQLKQVKQASKQASKQESKQASKKASSKQAGRLNRAGERFVRDGKIVQGPCHDRLSGVKMVK